MTEGVLQHTSSLALYMNKRIESDAVKTYFWAHENLSFFHSTNFLGTHSITVNSLVVCVAVCCSLLQSKQWSKMNSRFCSYIVRSYILASICSPAFEIVKILAKHKASFFYNWDKIQKSQRHSLRISSKKNCH